MQQEILKLILNKFTQARSRNSSYSLRSLAKNLGVQPSALSEILNGKRVITNKMGKKILYSLGLSQIESDRILNNTPKENEQNLSLEHFKIISDWQYFAILSLSELPDFISSPEWVANRLNISSKLAEKSLAKLIKLEMLVLNENGVLTSSGIQYKTSTDIRSTALKNHTLQTMELSKDSLLNDPVDLRDFSTITMAINTDKIAEGKKMIKSFRKKLSKKLESGNKNEVYKLAIQLFPLSRGIKDQELK